MKKFVFTNTCDGYYNAMDVHFTPACDNNCDFCIDKMYDKQNYKTDINKMIEAVKKEKPDIMLILGGEPFINTFDLLEFVQNIRPVVKELYITTTLPHARFPISRHDPVLSNYNTSMILELIDGLNVSIQSLSWEENNKILKASVGYDRINVMHGLILAYPKKIRINLNLVKGGIDTKEKLNEALNKLDKIGCQKVKINELQHTHKNYISYEKIMNYKWESAYAHGCQTFLKHGNMEVLIKRACFITEFSNKATLSDIFKMIIQLFKKKKKYRVLWGDGVITNNWSRKW
jgi:molybdenum cofactor biosynthesis enzyme MoaA